MLDNNNKSETFDIWLEDFITGLLDRTGMDIWIAQMDIDENAKKYIIELDGDDKGRAIGRDGQMLNSIQHLAVAAASNQGIHDVKIEMDVDGYRRRRDGQIEEDTEYTIQEVMETGEAIDMEPMCARDRRLVHMCVSKTDGVTSESYGRGKDRSVRIVPEGK